MSDLSRKRYVRRLSGMERYSLVINEVSRYHVDGIVDGVGDVDEAALRQAVASAAEVNPGVRVRLKGILGFSRWVDSGESPRVYVVNDSDWDGRSQQHLPFPGVPVLDALRGGAIADVVLVRCRDQRTRLIFRGLHAALDGRGMLHWMIDVFRVMRGEAPEGAGSTLTDMEVQERFREQVASAEPSPAPTACLPAVDHAEPGSPLSYIWRRIRIERNVSQMLPKTALFLADWARRRGEGDIGFTVPVDYRGLRIEEMGTGNLTGYLRLSVAKDDNARTLMLQLAKRLRAYADCRQFPGLNVILWLPVWYMARQLRSNVDNVLYTPNVHMPTGGIVSMGTLRREDFSCPGFQGDMTYAIPGAVGKLNVVFVNYVDSTVVTFAAPAAYNHQGQLDAMIQAYEAHFST